MKNKVESFQPMPKRFKIFICDDDLPDKPWREITAFRGKPLVIGLTGGVTVAGADYEEAIELQTILYGSVYKICQSTNLFDKDGNEIFEGSIVEWGRDKGVVELHKGKLTFHVVDSQFDVYHELYPNADMVMVIGHILSNPELLEKK